MLKDRIEQERTQALKSRDELRLSVLRLLAAALHNAEIEKRTKSGAGVAVSLSEEEALGVVRSELKKRRDASEAFRRGGRTASALKERAEAEVLSAFLPAELSDEEVSAIVREGRSTLGIISERDFGKLMMWVMQRVGGRASGERISHIVRREIGT